MRLRGEVVGKVGLVCHRRASGSRCISLLALLGALALASPGSALPPPASSDASSAGTLASKTKVVDAVKRGRTSSGPPVNVEPPIAGGALVDEGLLVAHPGTWTGPQPIAFTYQWLWCYGGELDDWCFPAGTGKQYVVVRQTPPLLRLSVTATNSEGSTRMTKVGLPPIGVPQIPPLLVYSPQLFGIATVGGVLEASEGLWYAPTSTQFSFRWWRCEPDGTSCTERTGLGDQYVITEADAGYRLHATVLVDPITPPGQQVTASTPGKLVPPLPAPPVNTSPPTIQGPDPPRVGDVLTAIDGQWSGAQPMTFTYTWWSCLNLTCTRRGVAKAYIPTQADIGRQLEVEVAAHNAFGSAGKMSNRTQPVQPGPGNQPYQISKPVIQGPSPPHVGDVLTTTDGEWGGDPPITFTYQWYSCLNLNQAESPSIPLDCTAVGTSAKTYIPTQSDIGGQISVMVAAHNPWAPPQGIGSDAANATLPVEPALSRPPPVNTSPPTVSGTTAVGDTLTASVGSWSDATLPFTYQWERCPASGCTALFGATTSTYTVTQADVPHRLRVVVTARNESGATSSASDLTDNTYGGVFEDGSPRNANFGGYSYRSPGNGPDFLGARASISVPWDFDWSVPKGALGLFRVVVQQCGGSRTDCPFLGPTPDLEHVPLMQIGVIKSNKALLGCADAPVPWGYWEYKDDSLNPFVCGYSGPSTEPDRAYTYMVRRRPPSAVGGSDQYWGAFLDGQMLVSAFLGFSTSFYTMAGGEINPSQDAGIRACYGPNCAVTNESHPQPPWAWTSTAGGDDWTFVQPNQVEQRDSDGRWVNGTFSTSGFTVQHFRK